MIDNNFYIPVWNYIIICLRNTWSRRGLFINQFNKCETQTAGLLNVSNRRRKKCRVSRIVLDYYILWFIIQRLLKDDFRCIFYALFFAIGLETLERKSGL